MTKEDDTVEDVSWDADAEDDGIEVANKDVLYGGKSLKGDDVVGVVPRNKAVYVIAVLHSLTTIDVNFHC